MEVDAVINGAGIVGLVTAIVLSRLGWCTAVLHGRDFLVENDSRVYALTPGVWQFLIDQEVPMPTIPHTMVAGMSIIDAHTAHALHVRAQEQHTPGVAYVVQHVFFFALLLRVLQQQPRCTLFGNTTPLALHHGKQHVTIFTSASVTLHAQVLFGADGVQSWVRQQLYPQYHVRDTHYVAMTTTMHIDQAHCNWAWQWFYQQSILAWLPVTQAHSVSVVWSLPQQQALRCVQEQSLIAELSALLPSVQGACHVCEPLCTFPILIHQVPSLVRGRVILLGDAAHSLDPLAGQGLNLGLRDVCRLQQTWHNQAPHRHCADGLLWRRWNRSCAEDAKIWWYLTRGLRVFFNHSCVPSPVRRWGGLGLALLNRCTGAKKAMTAWAMM